MNLIFLMKNYTVIEAKNYDKYFMECNKMHDT